MPTTKSAKKRHRQSLERRTKNRAAKSAVKTQVRKVRGAVEAGDMVLAERELRLAAKKLDPDEVMLQAIDAGADDVDVGEDVIEVYTDFKQLAAVRQALLAAGLPVSGAEKYMRAKTTVDAEMSDALKALKLIEKLEDLDDVQKVYSNLNVSDELAEQFANE